MKQVKVTVRYFSKKDLTLAQKVLAKWIGDSFVDDRSALRAWVVLNRFLEQELAERGADNVEAFLTRNYNP